jgi:uncharacterized protein YycO
MDPLKKYWLYIFAALSILIACSHTGAKDTFQTGDIIFQSSESSQCKAVKLATHSPYSHCGMIYINDGKSFVYEAIGPVTLTPLEEWIARGTGRKYVVKRLKTASKVMTAEAQLKLKEAGKKFNGKAYDFVFGWSDEKIYCSELVWKMYQSALSIEVGKLRKLKDFDLSSDIVKAKLKERYGNNVPYDEDVVAPSDIFASEQLMTVSQN